MELNVDLPDLEKLFDEKLSGMRESIAHQFTYVNQRIDNQVRATYFIVGGLVFPLIIFAITALVQKL